MEKLKTAVIVFLVLTMCIMSYLSVTVWSGTGWFSQLFEPDQGEYIPPSLTALDIGTVPYKISVSSGSMVHTQSRITAQDELYKDIETLLYEAIGSMEQATSISEEDFFALYGGQAVTTENSGNVPLYLMGDKVRSGNAATADYTVRTLTLFKESKAVFVGFRDESSGRYFKSQTAASLVALEAVVEKYRNDNGMYAHELGLNNAIQRKDRYQILATEPQTLPVYQLTGRKILPDGQEQEEQILNCLGVNPYLAKSYQENSGTKVYVEDSGVVRFGINNGISYTRKDAAVPGTPLIDTAELINLGISRIGQVAATILPEGSEITLDLASVTEAAGVVTVSFYTMLDGAMLSDGKYGAGFSVQNGGIDKLWFDIPQVEAGGSAEILSEADGARVAGRLQSLRFMAMYSVQGNQLLPYLGFVEE